MALTEYPFAVKLFVNDLLRNGYTPEEIKKLLNVALVEKESLSPLKVKPKGVTTVEKEQIEDTVTTGCNDL